ncbi:MAG: hypothetical protein H0T08_05615, partial [Acidobacteria bacterium]|nr:hypothetical protein [Acidobacteriota bacterium]
GGAFGVAIMGAFLTAGLATELKKVAQSGNSNLTIESAAEFASNPNALIDPQAKADLPSETLEILQTAMAGSVNRVFWLGAGFSALALLVTFLLPRQNNKSENSSENEKGFMTGEKMLMAEQTVINARNEPIAKIEHQN